MQQPGLTHFHNSIAGLSSTPSQRGSQASRSQSEMKDDVKDELKNKTYIVKLVDANAILHANPETVTAVINSLETIFQALTSGGVSSETDPRLPANGFGHEPESYDPLAHIMNKIVEATSQHVQKSPLSGLRFHTFGRELKDTHGSQKPLKPDFVGIIGDLPTTNTEVAAENSAEAPAEKPSLRWKEVEVVMESKAAVKDLVKQLGTYCRSCFLSKNRRFFSLSIGFHYKKNEAYIFAYHRGGLSSSRPMKLTTREGFHDIVKHMVGILSFKDEVDYGLDPTRNDEDIFCLNNRYYRMDRLIFERPTLRGRCTTVYSLQGMYICEFRV